MNAYINRKTKKIVIFALFMLSLVVTSGTFAYWATYVNGTSSEVDGILTIGSAQSVNTAFVINNNEINNGVLVPMDFVNSSNEDNAVDIVYLTYDIAWIEDAKKSQLDGNTVTEGAVSVTHTIYIYQNNELVPLEGNESVYDLIHVTANASNPQTMILDAPALPFRYTVTMDEPSNQIEYDIISKSQIVVVFDYIILDNFVTTTDELGQEVLPDSVKFNITYYDVDDTVLFTQEVIEGTSLSDFVIPDNPTKEGYTFIGWSSDLPDIMPGNDVSIYASYVINSYSITFVENGGSPVEAIVQEYNTIVEAPSDPSKDGYIFTGWYTTSEYAELYEFTTIQASDEEVFVGYTATLDTVDTLIQNHSFDNLDICAGTESAAIEEEVYLLLNDPFITIDYVLNNGDGSFTLDMTQTYNNTVTKITLTASFVMCDGYPANLLGEVQEEIILLLPSGIFDNIQVPNLNETTKTAGIESRLQALIDKYDVTIDVVYDDSVKDNGSPYTDTSGMTGTAMGMVLTITLTYDGVTVTTTIDVVTSFVQSKEIDTYTIPDTFIPY
jgi:hypothetical protein